MDNGQPQRKDAATVRTELSAADAKVMFGDLLSRIGFGGEQIVVTRHGKPLVAMIPMRDFEFLLSMVEDRDATAAVADASGAAA